MVMTLKRGKPDKCDSTKVKEKICKRKHRGLRGVYRSIGLQTHFDAIAADDFWKHCGQKGNCSWLAISPLATMFSTLFNN